jgi:hypothetical protein
MTTDHRTSTRAAERLRAGQGCEAAVSWPRSVAPEHRAGRVYSCSTVGRRLTAPMAARGVGGSHRGLVVGAWVIAGGLVGLLGACAPDDELPLPPVVWEGESVRVRMDDPEIEVCGGSFEALDRHAALVREALLLEGDGVIEYSIGDQDFVDERCTSDSPIACTKTTTGAVFTTEPFIQHEIVHAVRMLDPHVSLRSSPIEEGLATLFGSDNLSDSTVPLDASLIIEDPHVRGGAEYYRAGYLTALLFESHGAEGLRSFDLLARSRSEDEAFVEAFGETKAEFAEMADDAPLCDPSQWRAPLLECDGGITTADPVTGAVSFTGDLRCGQEQTFGPEQGRMWTTRHFRLDEATNFLRYSFEMPDDATLEIVACDGGCPGRFAYVGTRYEVNSFGSGVPNLEPGDYYLRLSRPLSGDDGGFEIILE